MTRKLRRLAPLLALCAGLLAPGAASAQAWSIGRPEPLPEFAPPPASAPPGRGRRPAAARPQVVEVSPAGQARATVELQPATGAVAEGDSTLVDELEITLHAPGPALWRVRRGAGEVVVVATYSPLPHLLAWDTRRLATALDGARQIVMPPEPKVGIFEGARLMLRAGALRLPGFTPLGDRLPPALAAKFDRAAQVAHADPRRYAKWRPAAAGLLLLGDFRRAAGLSDLKPDTTIARLARAKHVPIRRAGKLGVGSALDALVRLSQPEQMACLDASLDQLLFESGHARLAAQAWADGRLREVKANSSDAVLDRCLLPQAGVRAALSRAAADAAGAIEEALAQPGRTVAVVDLRLLDRPDGVLDRLKAAGATVDVPGA